MRNLLLLSLLFVAAFSFGQSAKKLNVELRADLNNAKNDYESVKDVYESEKRFYLKDLIAPLGNKAYSVITENNEYLSLKAEVFDYNESLKLLRGQTKAKASFSDLPVENLYGNMMERIDSDLGKILVYEVKPVEVIDTLRLNVHKVKVENALLQSQIDLYRMAEKDYQRRITQLRTNQPVIELAMSEVDSIYWNILNRQKELSHSRDSIRTELDKLETNYKKFGPKGFPEAYTIVFPHAFDLPEENIEDAIASDYGVVDNGIDAVPTPEIPYTSEKEPEIYSVVDEQPHFPGGMEALNKYLANSIVLPGPVLKNGVSGKCFVRFLVSEKGEISQVQIIRGIAGCPECNAEAKRVVEKMPDWIPGKINGRPVSAWFNLPVLFAAI